MHVIRLATLFAAMPLLAAIAPAQTTQTTLPTALDAVDRELQALFHRSRSHLVRAQVPIRLGTDHPMLKWRLQGDARLQEHLDRVQQQAEKPRLFIEPTRSTTQPGEGGSTQPTQSPADVNPTAPSRGIVVCIEHVGLVLNDRGDVLLPVYLENEELAGPLRINPADQQSTIAKLIASDEKAALTIIRMERPAGMPVRFANHRPADGALVLMISATRSAARLEVWAGGADDSAILFNRDGEVAGIVREGRELYGNSLIPLVDQLVKTGRIRRAVLGAKIHEVSLNDPHRLKHPLLGTRPAAMVDEMIAGSPGQAAGLKVGDVILSLAGEPFQDMQSFAAALGALRGPTELRILRDENEVTLTVDLQPR